jgi:hypothetical protein
MRRGGAFATAASTSEAMRPSSAQTASWVKLSGFGRFGGGLIGAFFLLLRLFGFPAGPLLLFVGHRALPSENTIANMAQPPHGAMRHSIDIRAAHAGGFHRLASVTAPAGPAMRSRQAPSGGLGQARPAASS